MAFLTVLLILYSIIHLGGVVAERRREEDDTSVPLSSLGGQRLRPAVSPSVPLSPVQPLSLLIIMTKEKWSQKR